MEQKGGVTIPVFDCIFDPTGQSIESFMRDYNEALYRSLPNLYAICITESGAGQRRIVAGFIVKTTYTHQEAEFVLALSAALQSSEKLRKFYSPTTSFLPAKVGVPDPSPLSEQEMLRIMLTQFTKHATGGQA